MINLMIHNILIRLFLFRALVMSTKNGIS